jgi:hypothetical protein
MFFCPEIRDENSRRLAQDARKKRCASLRDLLDCTWVGVLNHTTISAIKLRELLVWGNSLLVTNFADLLVVTDLSYTTQSAEDIC